MIICDDIPVTGDDKPTAHTGPPMRLPRRGIDDPDHGPRLLGIDLGRRQCRPCTVPPTLPSSAHARSSAKPRRGLAE